MNDGLNRTPEWARLKRVTFLTIVDEPGRIIIRHKSSLNTQLNFVFVCAIIYAIGMYGLGRLFGELSGWVSGILALFFASIVVLGGVVPGKAHLAKFADTVIYTPHGITFAHGGHVIGTLYREGMQQIVADRSDKFHHHRFLADTGFVCAFPQVGPTYHLLINNILMVGFAQPVHLDVFPVADKEHSLSEFPTVPNLYEINRDFQASSK